jgi:TolB-like protein
MLKRNVWLAVFVAALTCTGLQGQTLDDAIKNAAQELNSRLTEGSTVAVINFQAQSTRLTDYAIDELNNALVHIGNLKVVERRRLDAVRGELGFNMSGEVSDESAQNIGRMFGARSIIMGSIDLIGSRYRIRFQAIATEGATIEYAFSEDITSDKILESLLQGTNFLVDFTFEERLKASGLNLLLGAGSFFVEKDYKSGRTTAIWEGIGAGLIVVAFATSSEEGINGYVLYPGLGCYAIGAVYGIIKAQTYHKPGSQVAIRPLDGLGIDVVPTAHNDMGYKLSYTWKF